jgi:hypothetical protein
LAENVKGGVLFIMNEVNQIRLFAFLPDKRNETLAPILRRMNENIIARGDKIEMFYSDNKCCGENATVLKDTIPSLGEPAGDYAPIEAEYLPPRDRIPLFCLGPNYGITVVTDKATCSNFLSFILYLLKKHSESGVQPTLAVNGEWNSRPDFEYFRKLSVLSVAVAGTSDDIRVHVYVFHLFKLSDGFEQNLPPLLKELLTDASVLKVLIS